MKFIVGIALLFFSFFGTSQELSDEFGQPSPLDNGWRLKKINDTIWIKDVSFPSTIHQALYLKKIIPDPYYGNNEARLKWIEETDWVAEYDITKYYFMHLPLLFLTLEGIEPYAKVYLNNQFIFESDNVFKKYSFDITSLIDTTKTNVLKIIFESPVRRGKELMNKNNIRLPNDERIYTRKPQFEYGWDWGPRFVTTGIKGSINLIQRDKNYIEVVNNNIQTKSYNQTKAVIQNNFTIYSNTNQTIFVNYSVDGYSQQNKKVKLKKGNNTVNLLLEVTNPELWWPSTMGQHRTYSCFYNFSNKKNYKQQNKQKTLFVSNRHAFCDIELVQQPDSIGTGFYFKVNGVPTYIKGFNVIPDNHISTNDFFPTAEESNIVDNASLTNSNMVRVWGGGTYFSNRFYEQCMEYGIMVWQDFMFACAMYPGDTSFLNNVREEIKQQVLRLRNYSNIALWCGNNEIDEAWKNWGWQKQFNYSKTDSTKIWNDYQKLFHEIIPSTLTQLNVKQNYISTSPQIGWGHKESLTQGDSHYWGVWWGKEPINTFEKKIPRFMSEFGMQAMPDLSTLKKVIADSVLNFNSPEFKNHQKHPTGFETLNHYLKDELIIPSNIEDYSFATQILQSFTLKTAIEAQRRAKPRCMGTLIWQLNDTWPVTSWSVIDSYNQKKLAFNQVQKSFQNILVTAQKDSNGINIYIINDDTTIVDDYLNLFISDFTGKKIWEKQKQIRIKGNTSLIYFHIDKNDLPEFDPTKHFLHMNLFKTGVDNNYHFVKLNQLALPTLKYKINITEFNLQKQVRWNPRYNEYYVIELTFETYIPYLKVIPPSYFTSTQTDYGNYCEYFPNTLIPGQQITVQIPKAYFKDVAEIEILLHDSFKSLNELLFNAK